MARKKKEPQPAPGSPAWMATFGDLMNLLLCFFILLFAFSSVDAEKYEQIAASFSNSPSIFDGGQSSILDGQLISSGISQLNELDEYFQDLGKESEESENMDIEDFEKLEEEKQKAVTEQLYDEVVKETNGKQLEDVVDIDMDKNFQYVRINLNGAILFDSGKAEIKKGAFTILSKVGDILKLYDSYLIKVEGHTDNRPITSGGSYKSNMWLSTARATTVFEYLTEKKGLDPKTLEASGRSEFEPIASNSTEKGRAKNRRVEIKIYSEFNK